MYIVCGTNLYFKWTSISQSIKMALIRWFISDWFDIYFGSGKYFSSFLKISSHISSKYSSAFCTFILFSFVGFISWYNIFSIFISTSLSSFKFKVEVILCIWFILILLLVLLVEWILVFTWFIFGLKFSSFIITSSLIFIVWFVARIFFCETFLLFELTKTLFVFSLETLFEQKHFTKVLFFFFCNELIPSFFFFLIASCS